MNRIAEERRLDGRKFNVTAQHGNRRYDVKCYDGIIIRGDTVICKSSYACCGFDGGDFVSVNEEKYSMKDDLIEIRRRDNNELYC